VDAVADAGDVEEDVIGCAVEDAAAEKADHAAIIGEGAWEARARTRLYPVAAGWSTPNDSRSCWL
jgi:hypothetical protein